MAYSDLSFKIIFITVLIALAVILSVQGAPADLQIPEKNCSDSDNPQENEEYDIIDQRQNGTENYRINVKDVVIIWAPAEALLAATALLDPQLLGGDLLGSGDLSELLKPDNQEPNLVSPESMENKPTSQNSTSTEAPANGDVDKGPVNPTSKPALLRSRLHSLLKRKPSL